MPETKKLSDFSELIDELIRLRIDLKINSEEEFDQGLRERIIETKNQIDQKFKEGTLIHEDSYQTIKHETKKINIVDVFERLGLLLELVENESTGEEELHLYLPENLEKIFVHAAADRVIT